MLSFRNSFVACLLYILASIAALAFPLRGQERRSSEPPSVGFRIHVLNEKSQFSSATVIDMNADGKKDIVSGAWWYEAPSWKQHKFREVELIRGRFDDYSNLAVDVDSDGDLDIISANYRSKSLYWSRNPGSVATQSGQLWERQEIDRPGPSETGRLVDINGDGTLDLLPNGVKFAAWYEIVDGEFAKHTLPTELAAHGVGAGDINGDGRVDIVSPKGWAEAPADPKNGAWRMHRDFELAKDCGLPIFVWDVDGDGDQDLVWSRGHNVGLYWTEQIAPEESNWTFAESVTDTSLARVTEKLCRPQWITHAIDTRFAALHTLLQSDINGDGQLDLIVGKRYLGHDGRDPGENDPLVMAWYTFDRNTRSWYGRPIAVGRRCGIDLDSVACDIDDDGDVDIVAPTRAGLCWLENLGPSEPQNHLATPNYAGHQEAMTFIDETGAVRPVQSALDHGVRRLHILDGMQQAMGNLPQPHERVPLRPIVTNIVDQSAYWRVHLTIQTEPLQQQSLRLPLLLLIPKDVPAPAGAVLCLHPTHFELGKAQVCGLGGKTSRHYAHELAQRGYVCLAPDYPSFAEYSAYDFDSDTFSSGSMKAIWDNIRCIDLLETLPCVDRDRIGVIGHSLGGHNALFTAAFDQRLRCVVTSCGFTAFSAYYDGNLEGWSSKRYMPLIRSKFNLAPEEMPFDFHEVLAAIAPRPLFVNAPIHDSNFAVAGVQECEDALVPVYKLLQRPNDFQFLYPNTGHDFPSEIRKKAYVWLDSHLKK